MKQETNNECGEQLRSFDEKYLSSLRFDGRFKYLEQKGENAQRRNETLLGSLPGESSGKQRTSAKVSI